jgi:hypothetical protein
VVGRTCVLLILLLNIRVVKHKTLISNLISLTLLPSEACALPSEGFVLFGKAIALLSEASALPGEAPGRLRLRLRDILGLVWCVLLAKQRPGTGRPVRPRGDRRGRGEPGLALRAKTVEEALRRLPVFLRRKYDRAPGAPESVKLGLVLVGLSVPLSAGYVGELCCRVNVLRP